MLKRIRLIPIDGMTPFQPDSLFLGAHGVVPVKRHDDSAEDHLPRFSTPIRNFANGRQPVKLDFASKGLTQVEFKQAGPDEGPEARLQGTAMYTPTPGWPLYTAAHSMQGNFDGVQFPVKVNFRVALTNFPEGTYGRRSLARHR